MEAFRGKVSGDGGIEGAGERGHEGAGAVEGAVDDGEVVDFLAAEEEGEVDVPKGLEALMILDER